MFKTAKISSLSTFVSLFCLAVSGANAQEIIEQIAFADQTITITQSENGEQIIAMGDRELGRNYFAGFDRVADIGGEPVAIFYLGDGGNACGPSTLIVWQNDQSEIEAFNYADECATPSPAVSDDGIYFVPFLNPGEEKYLKRWSAYDGMVTMGKMRFTPEPGTTWKSLAGNPAKHPLDFFQNEEIHAAAEKLLGDDLEFFAKGLRVASQPKLLQSGIRMASGCVPHNCGSHDAFIAVDVNNQALFLAQQSADGHRHWPKLESWSDNARKAFEIFLSSR